MDYISQNKLSVAGMNFQDFGNPTAIYLFIWIIWIYFIYRFALYFKEDELSKVIDITIKIYHSCHDKYYSKLLKGKGFESNMVDEYTFQILRSNNFICNAYCEKNLGGYRSNQTVKETLHFSFLDFLPAKFNFCFYLLLATTITTNYIVPPFLSIVTFYLSFNSTWEGALKNVITSL